MPKIAKIEKHVRSTVWRLSGSSVTAADFADDRGLKKISLYAGRVIHTNFCG